MSIEKKTRTHEHTTLHNRNEKREKISRNAGGGFMLLTSQVRVVRRVDEIVAKGLFHVVTEIKLVGRHDRVILAQKETQKSFSTQESCCDKKVANGQ